MRKSRGSGAVATTVLKRSGLAITTVGLGTASIGGLYRACTDEDAAAVFEAAHEAGIRYFDTAPFYGFGRAEQRLGAFLSSLGDTPDCVVSTKVGRVLEPVDPADIPDHGYVDPLPNAPHFDYSRDGILRSYESSLARLNGRRPDILYVHDIGTYTHGAENARHYRDLMEGGLAALAELKAAGDVKAIGLGVNEVAICEKVLADADIDIILLAGRYSLLDRSAEPRLLGLCREREVAIVAGGVFNSGILATGARPGANFDYGPASPEILDRVERLQAVCRAEGVDLPVAAMQFPGRCDVVASTLIGTAELPLLAKNLAALATPVPPTLWPAADAVARG
ncbi:aldo/keto reductase [Jiella sp. M17.18]|uniref:aldo/keto reductase n=1 Tax=Jiella sp. M17.18 TaxID=3234247 RepID=UPI0034E02D92